MTEEKAVVKKPHNVIIEGRKSITVSGVSEIDSFDENAVIAITSCGGLNILGDDLHVNKLNTEDGELLVSGNIRAISYSDNTSSPKGFFGKIFK